MSGSSYDRALSPILGARDVAFRIVATKVRHPNGQRKSEADHRGDKLGVEFKRVLEKTDGGVLACLGFVFQLRRSTHPKIDRVRIVRPLAHRPQSLGFDQLNPERIGEARDELHLQLAELAALAVEPVGPDMRAGLGRDELGVDRDLLAEAAHAAFEHIAHAEFAPDLLGVDGLALVGEGGVAGDDETVRQMREIGSEVVGEAIREIVLFLVAVQIFERQHDDREARSGREYVVDRSRPELGTLAAASHVRQPSQPVTMSASATAAATAV